MVVCFGINITYSMKRALYQAINILNLRVNLFRLTEAEWPI